MTSVPKTAAPALALFRSPYDRLLPCRAESVESLSGVNSWKGSAIIWQLSGGPGAMASFEALRCKPYGLPLIVLLPPPAGIRSVLEILPQVRYLSPRMILPHGLVDTPYRLQQILASPPRSVAATLTDYMVRRGLLRRRKAAREFQRIVELAPDTPSISALSRRMYTSRRTLGRHFISSGIPVPSHCLQFARLFHAALQLQNDENAVFRIASRFGYADGFTLSNQMKRMIGHRPSEVRELLGWEWIVEAWLEREGR
ncbi:MAG: helix-turn-helix transcriptional regulator [Gemmatimonadetes bacterium]|nr:helix-turn-helix transcriptional regulator [Gemmatimonadota bacterium]